MNKRDDDEAVWVGWGGLVCSFNLVLSVKLEVKVHHFLTSVSHMTSICNK